MPVHEVAASGFDSGAEVYEQARPSYPPEAVAWLAEHLRIGPDARVADVAAGTGKLTRLLSPLGAMLVGVEPVAGMRAGFVAMCPDVPLVASTAEQLPLARGTLDAITVAQGFHWFDAPVALTEFARVLVSGGRLGLIWNARDRSNDLVDRLWSIMDRVEKRAPWRMHERWSDSALEQHAEFTDLVEATFHHEQLLTRDQVVARFRSVSHIAVLPLDAQEQVLDEIRGVLATHPLAAVQDRVAIPYRVDAYWCERR
jgi:ubiquinone/menaquinone biosynthesis C-methylase UbiE